MRAYMVNKKEHMRSSRARTLSGVTACMLIVAALSVGMLGCSPAAPAASSSSGAVSSASSSSASDATEAGDITVTVNMSEAVTSPEAADSPLQFAEEQINVVCPDGSTAIEVLQATGREVKTDGEGVAEQVVAIGGLANGDAGESSAWTYQVNGTEQSEAPGSCVLHDGDTLSFVFVG